MTTDASAFHDFEQAGWQRAAEHYGDAFGALTIQAAESLLDAVNAAAGTRLLDVATGPGVIAAAAAARGARVVGLDFSPAMMDARRVLRPGGHYAFTVWGAPELAIGFGLVIRAVEKFGRADVGLPAGPPFFQFSDAA